MTFRCSEIKCERLPVAHSTDPAIFASFRVPACFLCARYSSLPSVPLQAKFIGPQGLCWSFVLHCSQSPSLCQCQVLSCSYLISQMSSQIFFEGFVLMTTIPIVWMQHNLFNHSLKLWIKIVPHFVVIVSKAVI